MSLGFGESVWEREGSASNELTKHSYIAAVSAFTTYGIVLASVVAFMTLGWRPASIWPVLGIGLAMPIVGILIATLSDAWLVSMFGYSLLVVGLGAITGPSVSLYETGVVITALTATAGVSVVMSLTGILYPNSLEGMGSYLFGGLLALVFVRFGQAIMAGMGISESIWYMPYIEYGAALLFSLYIVYDWNRALRLPHTLDNAVDCSMAIFLDIINLFITLLRIFGGVGKSKD
ncbi:MAG: US12 family protein [Parcubacteria group bacterium]|nr:US12 family protein [Parcubacteria group bacterium]